MLKKKFEYQTLDQVFEDLKVKGEEYDKQYAAVQDALKQGKYLPVKSANLNGKNPPLGVKYKKVIKTLNDPALKDKLKDLIYINPSNYLDNLDCFKIDQPYVEALNKFLSEKEKFPPCSERERCYQIWGDEKFLSEKYDSKHTGQTILSRCGITTEKLKIYPTSEPLPQFSFKTENFDKILIVENSDPFTACQKVLTDKGQILEKDFGVIIYGGGKRCIKAFESGMHASPEFVKDHAKCFYYWGDLDYEGISIYNSVAKALRRNGYKVIPWTDAYVKMLERTDTTSYYHLPNSDLEKTKKGQKPTDLTEFLSHFDAKTSKRIQELLASRRYIAQEILPAWVLERMSENG